MQQQVTGFVHMEYGFHPKEDGSVDYSRQTWAPAINSFEYSDSENIVFIGRQVFAVNLPDDFNPVPAQVAALEKRKAEALEKYQQSVAELNERLQKLLAITFEA